MASSRGGVASSSGAKNILEAVLSGEQLPGARKQAAYESNLLNNTSSTPCSCSDSSLAMEQSISPHQQGNSYLVEGFLQLDTQDLSSWIGDRSRIGMVFHGTKLSIPVKCTSKITPVVTVEVIPRASLPSRMLTVQVSLLIPTKCSRHKWLVQYADSAFHFTCSVNRERQNPPIATVTGKKRIASLSGSSLADHETSLALEVMSHDQVLYDKAGFFTLHLRAEVVVYGYHDDASASAYKVVDLEDLDAAEIVRAQQ
jgi:hypothetical protein